MSLITLEQAAERYGKSKDFISSTACQYKKQFGKSPKWHISDGRKVRVDTDEYERFGKLERKAWVYATDHLYWVLMDSGVPQRKIAKIFSDKSKRFKGAQSWNSFMSNNLFSIPPDIVSGNDKSMRIEFVQIGTRIVYEMIKKGYYDEVYERNQS